jgi:hypothetical protein
MTLLLWARFALLAAMAATVLTLGWAVWKGRE